jgi:hypothetical protein
MGAPTTEARVLKFFAQRVPGSLGVTQLLKLAYLADLYAREYLGRPITGYRYTFYRHGPFDKRLYSTVDEMDRRKWVRTERQSLVGGRSKRAVIDQGSAGDLGFTPAESRILDYVAATYGHLPLDVLLAKVYDTEPMKAAKRDGRVPMELVDNRARNALGYDLEAVLREEEAIRRGDSLTPDGFFDGLRAELVAGDAA